MKKPKVVMTVIKEDVGYSAFAKVDNISINTQGETFQELKAMILDVVNLSFEDTGFVYTIDEIGLKYNLESFFAFYKILNAKALSKRIGMDQALLAQYVKGLKKPSSAQTRRILKGVQEVGRELVEVEFVV
jgi:hypothetical protein